MHGVDHPTAPHLKNWSKISQLYSLHKYAAAPLGRNAPRSNVEIHNQATDINQST
jgi:hypothetical protein